MQAVELRKADGSEEVLSQIPLEEDASEVLGRDEQCGLVLIEETISRYHAEIYCEHGKVFIRDHSSNGTLVNGVRIKRSTVTLKSGSLLKLGSTSIKVVFLDISESANPFIIKRMAGGQFRKHKLGHVRIAKAAIDIAAPPAVQIQTSVRATRKTVPYLVPVDDPRGSVVDDGVERVAPGDDQTSTPPEKIREVTMSPSTIRARIRDAIEQLPLDGIALRSFYDAYQFRRSIVTTDEGDSQEEIKAIAHALERALTLELAAHSDTDAAVVPVSQTFKSTAIQALELVANPPLRIFNRMVERRGQETGFDESVADALCTYADHAQNGLMPGPW